MASSGVALNPSPLLTMASGDQTAALTRFLAAPTPLGVKKVIGTGTVSGTVPIPAGVYLDLSQATVTQTAASMVSFTVGANATIWGGAIIGLGTDYIAGTNIFPTAIGIKVIGPGASVIGATISNHAGAGILLYNAAGANISRCTVTGVAPGQTIPAGDSACFSIYAVNSPYVAIDRVQVSECSIGLITDYTSNNWAISNLWVYNILGQHGAYLQNGTGLVVTNVSGDNVNYDMIKLQLHSATGAHQLAPSFSNITGRNIGDTVLTIANTDANLAGGYKTYTPTINGVTGYNCSRVLYLGSVVGGTTSNIAGYSTTTDFITLLDIQDHILEGFSSHLCGKVGVRLGSAPGALTQRITLKTGRIYNPGGSNVAGSQQGVLVGCSAGGGDGADITIDDVHVSTDNGLTSYGIQFSFGDTASYRQRNCAVTGTVTGRPFALPAGTTTLKEWRNNDNGGTLTQNFPTGAVVLTGSNGDTQQFSCNAIPTTGLHQWGAVYTRNNPAASGAPGWVCTVTGGAVSGTWAASTTYAAGVQVSNGTVCLLCTVGGTSGSTAPVNPGINNTVVDGGVTWQEISASIAVFKAMANLAA